MNLKDCEGCKLDGTPECEMCEKRVCRVCGCTWNNACPGGCYWVEKDLCSSCVEKEGELVQRLIYTFDINEEFSDLTGFFELLEAITEDELGCTVIRSKLETSDEIISKGEWEQ